MRRIKIKVRWTFRADGGPSRSETNVAKRQKGLGVSRTADPYTDTENNLGTRGCAGAKLRFAGVLRTEKEYRLRRE